MVGHIPCKLLDCTICLTNRNTITALNHRFDLGHKTGQAVIDPETGCSILSFTQDRYKIPGPIAEYLINPDGFRSQTFKEIDKDKTNVLFAGCSWTFGEGVLQEDSWTSCVSEKISEYLNKEVDAYNVAVMGASPHLTIKNIMGFIRKYGKPDYIFAVIPGHSRKILFSEDTHKFFNGLFPENNIYAKEHKAAIKRYVNAYDPRESLLEISTMIGMLEDLCMSLGINLLWSAYDEAIKHLAETVGHPSYIDDPHNFVKSKDTNSPKGKSNISFYPNSNNVPYWEIAYDDLHPGAAWHHDFSNTVFKELLSRGMI